ncbi:hypothetical protein NDU88_006033 [Pleurodeles waltl]|uniref:Secreted protein n=1 Tax=Pleurodeles waltl TaxID=8319 RepID=A0AAV7SNF5_PLEWA|nr:hypothetical protein NDU88_006033 [Pleurodeles waltl]
MLRSGFPMMALGQASLRPIALMAGTLVLTVHCSYHLGPPVVAGTCRSSSSVRSSSGAPVARLAHTASPAGH